MLRRTSDNNAPRLDYRPAAVASVPAQTDTPVTLASTQPTRKAEVVKPKPIINEQAKPVVITKSTPKEPVVVAAVKPVIPKKPVKTTLASEAILVKQAIAHVRHWADAWKAQNVSSYITAYIDGYRPANGLSNRAWQAQRKQRLSKPTFIQVSLTNITASLSGSDKAKVTFDQTYRSNTFKDKTRKQISLQRIDNEWRITEERSL